MIGPPRDYHLVEGLDIKVVDDYSEGVDIIINTGPWGDNDILENYTDLLDNLIKFNSLMICSNPHDYQHCKYKKLYTLSFVPPEFRNFAIFLNSKKVS